MVRLPVVWWRLLELWWDWEEVYWALRCHISDIVLYQYMAAVIPSYWYQGSPESLTPYRSGSSGYHLAWCIRDEKVSPGRAYRGAWDRTSYCVYYIIKSESQILRLSIFLYNFSMPKIPPLLKNLLLFLWLLFLVWFFYTSQNTRENLPETQIESTTGATQKIQSQVSEKVAKILADTEVQKTLERIKKDDGKYQKDGAIFMNRERRLPVQKDRSYYEEWTVTTPWSWDRGARRIISGKAGELWFTDDHYGTFLRIQ